MSKPVSGEPLCLRERCPEKAWRSRVTPSTYQCLLSWHSTEMARSLLVGGVPQGRGRRPPAPQPRAVHLASWCCRGAQPPGTCSSLTPICPRHAASVCSYHSCLIASRECTKPISFINICVEGFLGTWALRLLFCSLPCASSLFAMGMICSSFVGAVERTQSFLPNRASKAEDIFHICCLKRCK